MMVLACEKHAPRWETDTNPRSTLESNSLGGGWHARREGFLQLRRQVDRGRPLGCTGTAVSDFPYGDSPSPSLAMGSRTGAGSQAPLYLHKCQSLR